MLISEALRINKKEVLKIYNGCKYDAIDLLSTLDEAGTQMFNKDN